MLHTIVGERNDAGIVFEGQLSRHFGPSSEAVWHMVIRTAFQ